MLKTLYQRIESAKMDIFKGKNGLTGSDLLMAGSTVDTEIARKICNIPFTRRAPLYHAVHFKSSLICSLEVSNGWSMRIMIAIVQVYFLRAFYPGECNHCVRK